MNTKILSLIGLAIVSAASTPSLGPFSQSGCVATHDGPLYPHQQKLQSQCFTKTVSGRCLALFKSYHYDAKLQKCVEGNFGGCQDGCQAFQTASDCENSCLKFSILPIDPNGLNSFMQSKCVVEKPKVIKPMYKDIPTSCFVKSNIGLCRMNIESYHFDVKTGSCIKSRFGGCDDGCFAFKTAKECEDSCWRATIDV